MNSVVRSPVRRTVRLAARSAVRNAGANAASSMRARLSETPLVRGVGTFMPPVMDSGEALIFNSHEFWEIRQEQQLPTYGSRVVTNLLNFSEDITQSGDWDATNGAVATNATTVTYDGTDNGRMSQSITILDKGAGRTFIISVNVRLVSGTISGGFSIQLVLEGNAIGSSTIAIANDITSTTKRFTHNAITDASGTLVVPRIRCNDAVVLELTEWQLEESTGRADTTTPSEIVSTGVGTGVDLVVNGTFDTDITGWIDTSAAGGAIAWNPLGYIDLVNTTGIARAENVVAIPTVIGATYVFTLDNIVGTISYHLGTGPGQAQYVAGSITTAFILTATATTLYIRLFLNRSPESSQY